MSNLSPKQKELVKRLETDHKAMGEALKAVKEGSINGEKFEELVTKLCGASFCR